MMIKMFHKGAMLCLVTLAFPAWAETEHATVTIPAVSIAFASEYVAEDAHLYEQQGLDAKIVFLAGNSGFNALINGSVDFSFSAGATLNRAAAHGQKMLAIANTLNRLNSNIVVRTEVAEAAHFDAKAPMVDRLQVLKNRTMVVDGINSVSHAYLRVMAKESGLDPDAMQVSAQQPGEMLAAFARKAIDGFVLGPPWPQTVVQQGTGVIVASSVEGDPPWLFPIGSNMVLARPDFCVLARSICMKMGHTMVAANEFIRDHPTETLAFLQKRFNTLDGAVVAAAFAVVRKTVAVPPLIQVEALANADRLNVEAGFMKPDERLKSYDDLFTNEFVR
jgi:ABC-type nitrate/sulfonate/bicarbonate transport system substrate-binding protein